MKIIYLLGIFLFITCQNVVAGSPCDGMPIWGEEARSRGLNIPLGCGLTMIYNTFREDINERNFSIDAPNAAVPNINQQLQTLGFAIDNIHINVDTVVMRGDIWILPFLNAYLMGGRTEGSSKTTISSAVPSVIPGGQFNVDFSGNLFGGGLTLAAGTGEFFFTGDINWSRTDVDVLSDYAYTKIIAGRAGYNIRPNVRVWVGALYEDIKRSVKGPLPNGLVPPNFLAQLGADPEFEIAVEAKHPTTPILGVMYEFSPNAMLSVEGSTGGREGITTHLSLRF